MNTATQKSSHHHIFSSFLSSSKMADPLDALGATMVKFEDRNDLVLASLHVACEANDEKVLRNMLRQFFGPELKDIVMHSDKIKKYVIEDPELKAGVRRLALVCAVNGSTECLHRLHDSLADGIDPNTVDDEGTPCLQLAINNYNEELAALLIEIGADVDQLDARQRSPLHWAVVCQQLDIVSLLLAKKAIRDGQDATGATPLHYAVRMCCQRDVDHIVALDILQRLLIFRASVDRRDSKGRTPLMWASSMGVANVCRMLIAKGAEVNLVDQDGSAAAHLAASSGASSSLVVLSQFGRADMSLRDGRGFTPLAIALSKKNRDCAETLISLGASADANPTPMQPPPPPPAKAAAPKNRMWQAAERRRAQVVRVALQPLPECSVAESTSPPPLPLSQPAPTSPLPPKRSPKTDLYKCYRQLLHLQPRPRPAAEEKRQWVDVGAQFSSSLKPRSEHQPTWLTYTRTIWLPSRNVANAGANAEEKVAGEFARLWHDKAARQRGQRRAIAWPSSPAGDHGSSNSGSGRETESRLDGGGGGARDDASSVAKSSEGGVSKLLSAVRLKVQRSVQEHERSKALAKGFADARAARSVVPLRSSYLATRAIKVLTSSSYSGGGGGGGGEPQPR